VQLILDTNYFYSLTEEQLGAIRARGLKISVSAMALIEASARSAKEGRMERLVTPATRLFPHVDSSQPIAQFAGEALKIMVAEERGLPSTPGDVALHARDWWEAMGTRKITAAKWRALASRGILYRNEFDQNWKDLCRRLDPDEAARWRSSGGSEATMRAYVEQTLALDPPIAQRVDDGWPWSRGGLSARRSEPGHRGRTTHGTIGCSSISAWGAFSSRAI